MAKRKLKKWNSCSIPDPENRFTGMPPLVEYIDGIQWRLMRSMSYRTKADEISTIKIPFVFDFASIPSILFWLYPPAGDGSQPYGIAATWHDWLYCHRKIGGRTVTRAEADDLFCEIAKYTGVSWWTTARMYRWIRLVGWIPWNRRKSEDIIP